jgi:hypothetical protein
MTPIVDANKARGWTAAPQVFGALSLLGRELASACIRAVFTRLPLAVAVCTLVCLTLAVPTACVLLVHETRFPAVYGFLLILIGVHLFAGVIWGLHRVLRHAAEAGLAVMSRRLPELIDHLLAPLVKRGEDQVPKFEIAAARRHLSEASLRLREIPALSRWRLTRRVTLAVARWQFRTELAVVEHVLLSAEQRGERHLSLASLTAFARDELVTRSKSLAEANLRQIDLLAAAVVCGLLIVPALILSLLVP